jgi:2-polyprenyl-3-methyl-5-hydroxy-6-metoxy-1,4-benzoquinol methylase
MTQILEKKRFEAALITKGTSTDYVYRLTLRLCNTFGMHGHLLEYGAGTGHLANQLIGINYPGMITCADILPRPDNVAGSVEWLQCDLNHPLPLEDESFDTIMSTEVIEHLENPRFVFREFYRLLRPKGNLIVTTPNQRSVRSLAGLLFGGHFTSFLGDSYPAHISALLQTDFERICTECGFASPQFYYTDSGGIPKLPSVRWQDITFGLLKGRAFSDNVAVVTSKP